jgi:hypothetical protein
LSDQRGGGVGVGPGGGGGGGGGGRGSDRSRQARDIQDSLKRVFSQLGINLNGTNKALVYNELTGILLVRATLADLKIAEAAIETLGGAGIDQSRPVGGGNRGSLRNDASADEFSGKTHLPTARGARAELPRFLQSEAESLEGKVKSADQALTKYREENQIVSLKERQNTDLQALIQARTDLSRAQSEAAVAQTNVVEVTRWEKEGVPLENIPQIAEDISIKELQKQLAVERSKLEGLLTKYKEKYPMVQESRAMVADLTNSIDERAKQIAASIKRKAELLKSTEETLENEVRQKEKKVMELSNQRIEDDNLNRDLQSKIDLLNKVLERKKETEIDE